MFLGARIAVFVDGDFWHGRRLNARLAKLSNGHNAPYWTAKIAANHARDVRTRQALRKRGWTVVRVWESELKGSLESTSDRIVALVRTLSGKRSGADVVGIGSHRGGICDAKRLNAKAASLK